MMIETLKGQFESRHEEWDESYLTGLLHQCGGFEGSLLAGILLLRPKVLFTAQQHARIALLAEANPFSHAWRYSEKSPGHQRGPEQ